MASPEQLPTAAMASSLPPPIDLRHMTSASALSPTRDHRTGHRVSQNLLGSRSPTSIPSSPTSIHSSSSAIFERDIEPIVPPSPPHSLNHPPNPHRIPRAKGTEQLENAVPSVLDSAAAVLGSIDDGGEVAIVAPALGTYDSLSMGRSSGFASPIGSIRSRSPSPLGARGGVGQGHARAELLLSIPHQPAQSVLGLQNIVSPSISLSGPTSPRPQIKATDTAAAIAQVSSSNVSVASSSSLQSPPPPSILAPSEDTSPADAPEDPSPLTTVQEHPPNNLPSPRLSATSASPSPSTSPLLSAQVQPQSRLASPLGSPSIALSPLSPLSPVSPGSSTSPSAAQVSASSHPPSPIHVAKKRLSFMSYADLLSSTPATLQSLSSLTTCASTSEPPPHIPSVSGLNIGSQSQSRSTSAAPSLRNFSMGSSTAGTFSGPTGGITHAGKRDSIAMLDNVGGEWERQGLGRGLEERLEALEASLGNVGTPVNTTGIPVALAADRKP